MTIREQQQAGRADASVGELVERLSAQVSALVRDEMALATAEMKRKGTQAGVGIGIGIGGARSSAPPERGAELTERAVDRGAELHQQVVERGDALGARAIEWCNGVKVRATERGSELRDQAVSATERARGALRQTPPDRWATLASAGLALVVVLVLVRRVRVS